MSDLETWIVETGGRVISKKAALGFEALSASERAIYCLWVIDYSVRNSGTLEPVEDLHPNAVRELQTFAMKNNLQDLDHWLASASQAEDFCESYYEKFDACGAQLRRYLEHP